MKKPFLVLVALIVLVSLIFFLPRKINQLNSNYTSEGKGTNKTTVYDRNATNATAILSASKKTASFDALTPGGNDTNGYLLISSAAGFVPPQAMLTAVRTSVRQYGDLFGGNPVGTNPEITSALNGNNPKQMKFLNSDAGMRINGQGELVDAWGTPLFFHQISGAEMEIHSAGPDKIMWTTDDVVTK